MTVYTSPALILATMLRVHGHGTVPAAAAVWPVFISHLPDDDVIAEDAICVYDTDGIKNGRIMRTGETIVFEGLMVRVRSRTDQDGYVKAQEIAVYLDSISREIATVGARTYLVERMSRSPVVFIGLSPAPARRLYHRTINLTATINQET